MGCCSNNREELKEPLLTYDVAKVEQQWTARPNKADDGELDERSLNKLASHTSTKIKSMQPQQVINENQESYDDQTENKHQEIEENDPLCICGEKMNKILLSTIFSEGEVSCSLCDDKRFGINETMYHCSVENKKIHNFGYYVCCQCVLNINNIPLQNKIDKYNSKIHSLIVRAYVRQGFDGEFVSKLLLKYNYDIDSVNTILGQMKQQMLAQMQQQMIQQQIIQQQESEFCDD